MECVIETKASMILQFIDGLRGDLQVTFEEGTSAAWLYDLLKPHVAKLVVCDSNAVSRTGKAQRKESTMASFDSPEMLKALDNIEKRNYLVAFEVLVPLAEAGNPKAQLNLANLYHLGWGVNVDGKKAVELYHQVAQQNIREEHLSDLAYHSLAMIYIMGLPGVEPDCERAAEYSARAKELGFEM